MKTIRDFPVTVTVNLSALPERSLWDVFDKTKFESDPSAQLIPLEKLIRRKDERNDPKFEAGTKPFPIAAAYKFMVLAGGRSVPVIVAPQFASAIRTKAIRQSFRK